MKKAHKYSVIFIDNKQQTELKAEEEMVYTTWFIYIFIYIRFHGNILISKLVLLSVDFYLITALKHFEC